MRHLFKIVEPQEQTGDYNEITRTWSEKGESWGEILDSETDYQFVLDGELVSVNKVIRIRFTPKLVDGDGIKHNNKVYRIANMDNEKELNRYLLLYLVAHHG